MWFVPSFLTQGSKFIFSHITTYVVAIIMVDIFQVLRKQTDKVCVFSYRLAWKLKVILSYVETVDIRMAASRIISFALVLSL